MSCSRSGPLPFVTSAAVLLPTPLSNSSQESTSILKPLTEDLTNFKNASMTKCGSHLDTLEGPFHKEPRGQA